MKLEIRRNNMGYNGACNNCGKYQDGSARQPYIVYFRRDGEKRGENLIACCEECARAIAEEKERA